MAADTEGRIIVAATAGIGRSYSCAGRGRSSIPVARATAVHGLEKNLDQAVSEAYYDTHFGRYGQVQLVIDASQFASRKNLFYLHLPVVGFIGYLLRTMSVMYGSTLSARSEGAPDRALSRVREREWDWDREKRLERLSSGSPPTGSFDILGDFRGPLQVFVPLGKRLIDSFREWRLVQIGNLDRDQELGDAIMEELKLKRPYPSLGALGPSNDADEIISTTFGSLGRRVTLRLIVRGYLSARLALSGTFDIKPLPLPTADWFEELLSKPT